MSVKVDAIYENGVLRPLQPLDLKEHEHVVVSVIKSGGVESVGPTLDIEFIDRIKVELAGQPAPGLDEVRRRLARIPGSMAADIIAERGDR